MRAFTQDWFFLIPIIQIGVRHGDGPVVIVLSIIEPFDLAIVFLIINFTVFGNVIASNFYDGIRDLILTVADEDTEHEIILSLKQLPQVVVLVLIICRLWCQSEETLVWILEGAVRVIQVVHH